MELETANLDGPPSEVDLEVMLCALNIYTTPPTIQLSAAVKVRAVVNGSLFNEILFVQQNPMPALVWDSHGLEWLRWI